MPTVETRKKAGAKPVEVCSVSVVWVWRLELTIGQSRRVASGRATARSGPAPPGHRKGKSSAAVSESQAAHETPALPQQHKTNARARSGSTAERRVAREKAGSQLEHPIVLAETDTDSAPSTYAAPPRTRKRRRVDSDSSSSKSLAPRPAKRARAETTGDRESERDMVDHDHVRTRAVLAKEVVLFAQSVERLSCLLYVALDELEDKSVIGLQRELLHDWRVLDMAIFVEGYLKGGRRRRRT